jgi:predicted PurR-regulated permease PerM
MEPDERELLHRGGDLELFAKKLALVLGVGLALLLLWAVREVLILVFIAAVLAAGISPAVHRVRVVARHKFGRRFRRGTAVLIVYFPFVIGAIVLLAVMVPRLIVDSHALGTQMPLLLDRNVIQPLERFVPMGGVRAYLKNGIVFPRESVIQYVRTTGTVVASFIAVLFMIVYMLIDVHRLRNLILLFYPASIRGERRRMLTRMGKRMSSWLSGQLILAAIIGVATFIGLLCLRIPYALPLAILATIGEMVPVIGPILGATPALAIAILASRWQFWSVLAMAVIFQKLENLFIAPRVMSRKVSISPLAVFIAFMMGASLLGIIGAVMAIPMAAIIQVSFDELFVARRERRHDIDRPGTLLKRDSA